MRSALHAAGFTRAQHLSRPEGPYTPQALPVHSTFHARRALHAAGFTPHYTPAALRVTILQFCREGGKKGEKKVTIYI